MSQRQFPLFPERRNERRAALHGAQAVARDGGEFGELLHAQIAELALLQVTPDVFARVQFGCIDGQELHGDVAIERFKVFAHEPAFVRAHVTAARQAVLTRFDWNIVTARLEKIYLDVTARVHAA